MTKDCRLTVRITSDLDTWLEAEGTKRGLDKAAFARMALFERMNGAVTPEAREAVTYELGLSTRPAPQRDVLDVSTPEPSQEQLYAQADGITAEQPYDGAPIDVDDLVNASLQDAEAQGLTQRREQEPPQEAVGGVRAIIRPPPRYSAANQPGWIPQH